MTDYKDLLIRYIAWVSECEGVDYIKTGTHYIRQNFFDDDEWEVMHELADAAGEWDERKRDDAV